MNVDRLAVHNEFEGSRSIDAFLVSNASNREGWASTSCLWQPCCKARVRGFPRGGWQESEQAPNILMIGVSESSRSKGLHIHLP